MTKLNQTAGEVFDSLTGHDEMAITQHFGRTVGDLTDDSSMWGRALVFVAKRREGANDDDARAAALDMRLKDVTTYFAEESEESGKDKPPAELPPGTSLSSAS